MDPPHGPSTSQEIVSSYIVFDRVLWPNGDPVKSSVGAMLRSE